MKLITNDSGEHRCIYVDRGSAYSLQSESNVNPLSSAAQMTGVTNDRYIHYYIHH